MSRPEFITNENIVQWDSLLDEDPSVKTMAQFAIIREVCYAGYWLAEELQKLQCPMEYITRIQFTGGQLSFGRDPWEVHQELLQRYKNNELEFEPESTETN